MRVALGVSLMTLTALMAATALGYFIQTPDTRPAMFAMLLMFVLGASAYWIICKTEDE